MKAFQDVLLRYPVPVSYLQLVARSLPDLFCLWSTPGERAYPSLTVNIFAAFVILFILAILAALAAGGIADIAIIIATTAVAVVLEVHVRVVFQKHGHKVALHKSADIFGQRGCAIAVNGSQLSFRRLWQYVFNFSFPNFAQTSVGIDLAP